MKIFYHQTFLKHFRKRIVIHKNLEEKFYERFNLLIKNPYHPLLRRHQLKGEKRSFWSFSVSSDIRVIYRIEGDKLYLYDIGTHAQVY